jgi:hypothetical protein
MFGSPTVTGEILAEGIWGTLASRVKSGTLDRVRLVHSRDLSFDCSAQPTSVRRV